MSRICALGAVLLVASCGNRQPAGGLAIERDPTPIASTVAAVGVVDDALMAYLSTARVLHHEADIAEDSSDSKAAIAALQRLLDKAVPRGAPEIDEVLSDTHARLGDLRAQLGDFDGAARDVDVGLTLARERSYFRGHLLEVRGLVAERHGKALAKSGDLAGAAKARLDAMKAYEEAIAVQDDVIKRGVSDGGLK